MNFVAATSKTFDHPTHGSLRGAQQSEGEGGGSKALLLAADPLTGEPLDRNSKGHWNHDEREDKLHNTLTNADVRRMHGHQRFEGGGMRSETEGAREARMAAAVSAAAGSSSKNNSHSSGDWGSSSSSSHAAETSERRDRERHKKKSRSRSRSRSGERRRHKSSRKRSRSR